MRRFRWIVLSLTVAALGAGAGALTLPLLALPAPTGEYRVGTLNIVLPSGTAVTLWYPARSTTGARRAPYVPGTVPRHIRERLVFPLVRTAAYIDAPVADGAHPVVLYLAGWGNRRFDNTALCEELASRGFAVAALDDQHPSPALDLSGAAAFQSTLRWADAKVALQARAASVVLSQLANAGPASTAYRVTRAMDWARVAAVGYSFGGASAAELAIHDVRVRAAVNLDGWTFGEAARRGVEKPFMIVGTGAPTVDPPAPNASAASGVPAPSGMPPVRDGYAGELDQTNGRQILAGFQRYGGYNITIDGTQHESFCDTGVLPVGPRPAPGAIDGRRAQRIIIAYVAEFLNATLNGAAAPLLAAGPGEHGGAARSRLDHAAELTVWRSPAVAHGESG